MQLAMHGLEMLDHVSEKVQTDQSSIQDRPEGIQSYTAMPIDNSATQLLLSQ